MGNARVKKQVNKEAEFTFVPMIDIVFQLLIFFLVAAKFKQIEQRLDTFLPTDEGQMSKPQELEKPEELSIFIKDNHLDRSSGDLGTKAMRQATFYCGSRDANPVVNAQGLYATVKALVDANSKQEVLIALYDELNDKDQLVPFFNVVQVIDVCKAAGVVNIKFQAPAQPL